MPSDPKKEDLRKGYRLPVPELPATMFAIEGAMAKSKEFLTVAKDIFQKMETDGIFANPNRATMLFFSRSVERCN